MAAVAQALVKRGLQPGDRVLMAAPNSIALVHLWLGAIYAGGIPAAVNPESRQPELDYFQRDLGPRCSFIGEAVEDFDEQASPDGFHGDGRPGSLDPLAIAAIVYTSGTTSRPKGVMVRHVAYTETGASFPHWLGLEGEQRLWACLPLFHINAQAYSLMSTLAHGYALALSPSFHASSFWQEAKALGVTSVNLVGAMLQFLARQPAERWVESALHTVYAAPGPDPRARAELESRFGLRILTGYGMSENPFGCIESATSREKPHGIGRPRQPVSGFFVNELTILDENDREAAVGATGELCFRNPVMTPGYWNATEISNAALRGGWLHTGDAGYRDGDGDVFLTGRYKEMIRRRGENVAPGEVEEVLMANPAVEAAAVFGIAAGLEEEEVLAAVVIKKGASIDERALKDFAETRLAAYKVPTRVFFREALPMTATHRVAKDLLRQEYGRAS